MAATLLDFKASEPSSTTGGASILPGGQVVPFTLTTSTTPLALADLGIFLSAGPQNRVELLANVGVNADTIAATATLTFTITRDGTTIFTATRTIATTTTGAQFVFAFQPIDFNVAAGFHTYVVQVVSNVAGVIVNGPISFTGAAYSLS